MLKSFEKYKLMWRRRKTSQKEIQTDVERNTKTLQKEIQIDVERNTKKLQKEIQIDVERNTNGCGPSYQPAADGGWMVAATTHKTNTKGKILCGKFSEQQSSQF